MKTGAKWGIGLGVGIPGVLILIGIIGLIIKFFMKRCRTKAWNDIRTSPKDTDSIENGRSHGILSKRRSSERQPLYPAALNKTLDASDGHISIPIDEKDIPAGQHELEKDREGEHTLVQIQRERLNRLKEKEHNARPMLHLSHGEDDIQRAIDQAQKEFEESVATATAKLTRRRDK